MISDILGSIELMAWCGGWPHFHDAEIVQLDLHRRGVSKLVISVMGGKRPTFGPRADDRYAVPPEDVVITFLLEDIEDLELADFSPQNVIFGLDLTWEKDMTLIDLSPCYGMAGKLVAGKVSVEFIVGGAPDRQR